MEINNKIDHTILKADAKKEDVIRYCEEAKKHGFASVCVNPYYVGLVSSNLEGSNVKTCCVVGFPLGSTVASVKAIETSKAVEMGADEIDMVINVGALKDGHLEAVLDDIRDVVKSADGRVVKVIIETCLLTDEEKKTATKIVMESGADFVKTSTGFSTGGAKIEDIKLIKEIVGDKLKIKASGGIRTKEFANDLIKAGADRIGASDGKLLI